MCILLVYISDILSILRICSFTMLCVCVVMYAFSFKEVLVVGDVEVAREDEVPRHPISISISMSMSISSISSISIIIIIIISSSSNISIIIIIAITIIIIIICY